jgi:hypothetical protein
MITSKDFLQRLNNIPIYVIYNAKLNKDDQVIIHLNAKDINAGINEIENINVK